MCYVAVFYITHGYLRSLCRARACNRRSLLPSGKKTLRFLRCTMSSQARRAPDEPRRRRPDRHCGGRAAPPDLRRLQHQNRPCSLLAVRRGTLCRGVVSRSWRLSAPSPLLPRLSQRHRAWTKVSEKIMMKFVECACPGRAHLYVSAPREGSHSCAPTLASWPPSTHLCASGAVRVSNVVGAPATAAAPPQLQKVVHWRAFQPGAPEDAARRRKQQQVLRSVFLGASQRGPG